MRTSRTKPITEPDHRASRSGFMLLLLLLASLPALLLAQTTTLHGTVLDATTGRPIARVLVEPPGAGQGVLTDNAGRFALPVETGTVQIRYRRPGYFDPVSQGAESSQQVTAAAGTPDQTLLLEAAATLRGSVLLPEGDSPAGLRVDLYQAHVIDGRRHWNLLQTQPVRSDGSFAFGDLPAGNYLLHSQASMDPVAAPFTNPATNPGAPPTLRSGYAPVFAPDAGEISAATVYTLQPGQTAEARLRINRATFYPISIHVAGDAPVRSLQVTGNGFTGLNARYSRQDEAATIDLPSGRYLLRTAGGGGGDRQAGMGELSFHVDGAPVQGLSLTVAPAAVSTLLTTVATEGAATGTGAGPRLSLLTFLSATAPEQPVLYAPIQTDQNDEATGTAMLTRPPPPGQYWVSAVASGGYVAALESGGTDLLRAPLTIAAGSPPQFTATLRQDSGSLAVTRSGDLLSRPGVIQLVPLSPGSRYQASTGSTSGDTGAPVQFGNLPPGEYLVLATGAMAAIAFREPGALGQLKGLRVTVTPGATTPVTLSNLSTVPLSLTGLP